jgi:hypothetical protein
VHQGYFSLLPTRTLETKSTVCKPTRVVLRRRNERGRKTIARGVPHENRMAYAEKKDAHCNGTPPVFGDHGSFVTDCSSVKLPTCPRRMRSRTEPSRMQQTIIADFQQ